MKKYISYIRIFLLLILIVVLFLLFWQKIIPSGEITYANDYTKNSFFISDFSPNERYENKEGTRLLKANPVYFNLQTPRDFDKAELSIEYKNVNSNKEDLKKNRVIEIGVLVDKKIWRYQLKPVENKTIDQLLLVWDVINENDVTFLQRKKKYNSISSFMETNPNRSEYAVYNYKVEDDFILNNYSTTSKEIVINVNLRGPFQFYTYLKDEELSFDFEVSDINKNLDEDALDIHLYYQDQLIVTRHLKDDGVKNDTGEVREVRTINLYEKNLPNGAYKIEIRANDDIITKVIKTKQNKISFINNLWLYKTDRQNLKLYTDSKIIHAKTTHPNSLQTINIGADKLNINKTYKQFTTDIKKASNTKFSLIDLKKDGVILAGDGVFSFSEDSLFSLRINKIDSNVNINNGINYVLTKYKQPITHNDWKTAKVNFDLKEAYREDKKYSFLISAPNLILDDNLDNGILVNKIEIKLEGKNLQQIIREVYRK